MYPVKVSIQLLHQPSTLQLSSVGDTKTQRLATDWFSDELTSTPTLLKALRWKDGEHRLYLLGVPVQAWAKPGLRACQQDGHMSLLFSAFGHAGQTPRAYHLFTTKSLPWKAFSILFLAIHSKTIPLDVNWFEAGKKQKQWNNARHMFREVPHSRHRSNL